MGSGQILQLYTSSRASQIKRLSAYFNNTLKRYSKSSKEGNEHGETEDIRAPSLADEFKRVAEEREREKRTVEAKAKQGITSQTVEKAEEALETAILEDSNVETVKEKYKEPVGKGNFHKTGDDETSEGVSAFSSQKKL